MSFDINKSLHALLKYYAYNLLLSTLLYKHLQESDTAFMMIQISVLTKVLKEVALLRMPPVGSQCLHLDPGATPLSSLVMLGKFLHLQNLSLLICKMEIVRLSIGRGLDKV